ncbi:MAG: PIN domain-containing protein [Bryobacteraceae bacterium]
MKVHLIDTNVLLRDIQQQDLNLRSLAREAIKKLFRQGDTLCICPQNLIELWNVSTRPTNVNGLGLGIPETQRNVSRCEAFFRLLPETPELFQEWKQLVSVHQVSGLKVHDARLVAAMNVHQLSSLITFDMEDFKRYPGITILHPQDVVR